MSALGTLKADTITNDAGVQIFNTTLTAEVASTSGSAIDFTGIPSGVKRIDVIYHGVSRTGTSDLIIQIGTASGIENTGYLSNNYGNGAGANNTAGFLTMYNLSSGDIHRGIATLLLQDAANFTWVMNCVFSWESAAANLGAGQKTLSAELNQVRITTANGSDAFAAGAISLQYSF